MAIRVIDDTKLQNIAVAIQAKDNGGQMTVDEMAGRIDSIIVAPVPVQNPALVLWDWEGTKLVEYSREDALALTELPTPSSLLPYAEIDHVLLLFQGWNWSLNDIKEQIQGHKNITLDVGAVYTTTDGNAHNYWDSPRGSDWFTINKRKQATDIDANSFLNCKVLAHINIPQNITIGNGAFNNCQSLKFIVLPESLTVIGESTFQSCNALTRICFPKGVNVIKASAFNTCKSLNQVNLPQNLTSLPNYVFYACICMSKINIPAKVVSIGLEAFSNCISLNDILLQSKPSLANISAFNNIASTYYVYVPRSNLSWFETETNWSTIYAQGHIVAIEDHIQYLESIGFDVEAYKEATP